MQPVSITWTPRPAAFRPAHVCIALADEEEDTRRIANAIAIRLHARGFVVETIGTLSTPPPETDALVLGSSSMRHSLAVLAQFVESARIELGLLATALFVVRHHHTHDPLADIRNAVQRLAWRPDLVAALDPDDPHHGALVRWVMHHVWPRREWSVAKAVDAVRFADAIAIGLARAEELRVLRARR